MEKELFDNLYKDVFTEQNIDELKCVIEFIEQNNPNAIAEIGMKQGGTLNFWRHLVPDSGIVVGVDVGNDVRWNTSEDGRVKLIIGNSLDYRTYQDFLVALGSRELDALFIDGGHTYFEAKSDFYTYGWHVRPGGLVIIHDIDLDSVGEPKGAVKQLWQEVKDRAGDHWVVECEKRCNTGVGIIRKL